MNHSELLKDIIDIASNVHKEAGTEYVSAPCIIVAAAQFCNREYKGLTEYDDLFYPEWYEEERLRYLCKKVLKGSGGLVSSFIKSKLKKDYIQYDTDFLSEYAEELETEALKREKNTLSADAVLLVAVKSLKPEHRLATADFKADFSVSEVLAEVDKNVYSYVIYEIDDIMAKLRAKSDQAKTKRDWKPATKFAEPKEMLRMIFDAVKSEITENSLKMIIPCFFHESCELRLVITHFDGVYYVHDDASAVAVLRKNTQDDKKFLSVFDTINKKLSLKGDKILGAFCQVSSLLHYLQVLIFVANGDLYYENLDEEGLYSDSDIPYVPEEQGESFDAEKLLEKIKQSVFYGYDENKGLYLGLDMIYSFNNTTVSYLVETMDDGTLKISDNKKGCFEGEIFETLYGCYDDITPFSDCINKFCKRFGAYFDGENVSITTNVDDFTSAIYRFISLAVLLSELGRLIDLS